MNILKLLLVVLLATSASAESFNIYEEQDPFVDTAVSPSKRVEVSQDEIKIYKLDKYGVQTDFIPNARIRIEKTTPTTSLQPSSNLGSPRSTLSDLLR